MNKTILGLMFILAGLVYGSLSSDAIYNATIGYLITNKWIIPPVSKEVNKNVLGRKPSIIFFSIILIIIGLYIIWNRKI